MGDQALTRSAVLEWPSLLGVFPKGLRFCLRQLLKDLLLLAQENQDRLKGKRCNEVNEYQIPNPDHPIVSGPKKDGGFLDLTLGISDLEHFWEFGPLGFSISRFLPLCCVLP